MRADSPGRHAFLLVAFVAVGGCEQPPPEPEPTAPHVRCVPAETRSLADTIDLRGTVVPAPDRSATLSAQVAGRLVRLAVREGDDVDKGALIAEVEAQPARDALQQARAALAQAVATRDAARTEATHEESLVERGIAARRTLEALRATRAETEAAVEAATARVHAAREGLSRTEVRAPMAGTVVHLLRREGELVDGTPATPICDVVDMSTLELAAPAAPADLVRLHRDQRARVRFDALAGLELPASVRAVGRSVGANGMGQVWLRIELGEARLPLGILGTALVTVSAPHEVVTVPAVAIRTAAGNHTEVVVCEDAVAHVREVQVGRRHDGWVEVIEGLTGGDRVATQEVTGLEDGTPIDVTTESP